MLNFIKKILQSSNCYDKFFSDSHEDNDNDEDGVLTMWRRKANFAKTFSSVPQHPVPFRLEDIKFSFVQVLPFFNDPQTKVSCKVQPTGFV